MDKQTFESLRKVADRLNKLEKSEKEFLLKDWPRLMKELTDFEVKGDDLLLNGKKIYEFYVPKDGKDGKDGIAGKDGKDGKNGLDGKDGKDGKDGTKGKDGEDGREIQIFVVDNKICWSYEGSDVYYDLIDLDKLKGKDGEDGKPGKNGSAGKGLPKGGKTSQIIIKASEKDYDTKWIDSTDLVSEEAILEKVSDVVGGELQEIKDTAERAETIAKGRATGYVFDTVDDLDLWLKNTENTSKLLLGDNLYVREIGVPDYWWDGSTKQPLETQKVDLSNYIKNTDYATVNKPGIGKSSQQYGVWRDDKTNYWEVVQATESDIDARTDIHKPITPKNLEYAVKSVVGGHEAVTQEVYDYLVEMTTVDEETIYYIYEEE